MNTDKYFQVIPSFLSGQGIDWGSIDVYEFITFAHKFIKDPVAEELIHQAMSEITYRIANMEDRLRDVEKNRFRG